MCVSRAASRAGVANLSRPQCEAAPVTPVMVVWRAPSLWASTCDRCCVCDAGLSYGSHTVGFTPPATLSRAAISHYNSPALHVHGSSSHAVAVSPMGHAHQERLHLCPTRPPSKMAPERNPDDAFTEPLLAGQHDGVCVRVCVCV